jgi:hypothetical protein
VLRGNEVAAGQGAAWVSHEVACGAFMLCIINPSCWVVLSYEISGSEGTEHGCVKRPSSCGGTVIVVLDFEGRMSSLVVRKEHRG